MEEPTPEPPKPLELDNGKAWFIYNQSTESKVHLVQMERIQVRQRVSGRVKMSDSALLKCRDRVYLSHTKIYWWNHSSLRYGGGEFTGVAKPTATGSWTQWIITLSDDGTSYYLDAVGAPEDQKRMMISGGDLVQGDVLDTDDSARFQFIPFNDEAQ